MRGRLRDENRDATIAALYTGGATQEEIGNISGGISRQRVQQILGRQGVSGYNGERVDPIHVVAVCRRPDVWNWDEVARQLGGSSKQTYRQVVRSLGMEQAIRRLFAWRYRKSREAFREARRAELAEQYRGLAQQLCRIPSQKELHPSNGTAMYVTFYRFFDGMSDLRQFAGLDATDRRGPANRKRFGVKRGPNKKRVVS